VVMKEKHLRLIARQNGPFADAQGVEFRGPRGAELAAGVRVDIVFALEEDAYSAARGYPRLCALLRECAKRRRRIRAQVVAISSFRQVCRIPRSAWCHNR